MKGARHLAVPLRRPEARIVTLKSMNAATKNAAEERPAPSKRQSPGWAPLRSPLFRAVWLASMASNIGFWMHEVGASWLMTEITKDAQLNALVAAASSLPMFLLALPAGALADIIDRRKLVVATQSWSVLVAGTLAVLTLMRETGPYLLLFFTLLMALGGAITGPAWQALLPEMVKKRQLPAAMSLGGAAWNLSRIIGPILAGVIIGAAARLLPHKESAPGVVFALNAVSYLGVVWVFAKWKREPRPSQLPPEHISGAMRAGWRYTQHSPELRAVLIRLGGYMICASAQFSLLPLYSRELLHLEAGGYATLLGFFGAAGVSANLLFPGLRQRFSPNQLIQSATLLHGLNLALLSLIALRAAPQFALWLARAAMLLGGVAWPILIQTCNVTMIRSVPDWVRSRAAGMFSLIFMGTSTIGSILWGAVARLHGIPTAFLIAASGLGLSTLLLRRFVVVDPGKADFSPSLHWPDPVVSIPLPREEGPVLVTSEFEIAPEDSAAFVSAMEEVRRLRLRGGTIRWNLFQDIAEPTRWVETALEESWNGHLRQHARVTLADQEIESAAHAFHRGMEAPRVSHLLAFSARTEENEGEDEESV